MHESYLNFILSLQVLGEFHSAKIPLLLDWERQTVCSQDLFVIDTSHC